MVSSDHPTNRPTTGPALGGQLAAARDSAPGDQRGDFLAQGLPIKPGDIRWNRATWREQVRNGECEWRPPFHGHRTLVSRDGRVAAIVRLLGTQLPRRDQRYSVRIEGVEWLTSNTLSPKPRFLTIRGFLTAEEAMAATEQARAIILASDERDARP